jgi:hypothetical protein
MNTSAKVPMNSARSLGATEFDILISKRLSVRRPRGAISVAPENDALVGKVAGRQRGLALAIAAIIPAAYLSWLDEHESRVKVATQIALFNNSVVQRRLFVGDALSTFYIEAQALYHEKITEGDFPDWARREGQFADRAKSWIQENMGRAALMKFQDMDGPSYAFASTAGDQHSDALNWLNRVSANLQALMHDPTWDAEAPKLP